MKTHLLKEPENKIILVSENAADVFNIGRIVARSKDLAWTMSGDGSFELVIPPDKLVPLLLPN